MNEEEIFEKLKSIISNRLGVEQEMIQMSSRYQEDLGADSLDLMDLVLAIEDAFHLEIPDADIDKIQQVGDTVSYIQEKESQI